jgi:hypothetical protein
MFISFIMISDTRYSIYDFTIYGFLAMHLGTCSLQL